MPACQLRHPSTTRHSPNATMIFGQYCSRSAVPRMHVGYSGYLLQVMADPGENSFAACF